MALRPFTPVPFPWTEHIAPSGHYYYYNRQMRESTYIRPLPSSTNDPSSDPSVPKKQKRKNVKERPMKKTEIPDTAWLRVVTTRGNVFYHNVESKESIWDAPDDISSLVAAMAFDDEEKEDEIMGVEEAKNASPSPSTQKRKLEEEEPDNREVKRKKIDENRPSHPLPQKPDGGESKQQDDEDEEEWQRQMAEEMVEEAAAEDVGVAGETKPEVKEAKLSVEEGHRLLKEVMQEKTVNPMLPWESVLPLINSDPRYETLNKGMSVNAQRDIFEEVCKEIIHERRRTQGATTTNPNASMTKQSQTPLEAYQSLLSSTVTSTRTTYTQFRNQVKKDRRFFSFGRDEREREGVFRSFLKDLGEKKKSERKKAEEDFVLMLREGLKKGPIGPNDTGKWSEFKKLFQKDKRYEAVGSSSLREELFETFLKSGTSGYANSSSGAEGESKAGKMDVESPEGQNAEDERKRRREKAVKEREEKVRKEKERVERANAQSRAGLNQEEAELSFNSLLIDLVRDPGVSFKSALAYLASDPRFSPISAANMSQPRLQALFNAHITRLQSKGATALHSLLESYAPGLEKRWDDLRADEKESLAKSGVVKKLGLDGKVQISPRSPKRRRSEAKYGRSLSPGDRQDNMDSESDGEKEFEYPSLRQEFENWQRQRYTEARHAFDVMLSENAFVEFWGRVGKMGVVDDEEKQRLGRVVFTEEIAPGSAGSTMDPEDVNAEGEGGGGKADLQALAKGVDVKEVLRVLRGDKRFIVFNYIPDEREKWVTDHLRRLTAPKASVHIG